MSKRGKVPHQALTSILLDAERSVGDRMSTCDLLLLRCFADEAVSDAATETMHQLLKKTFRDLRGLVVKEVPANAAETRQKSRRDGIQVLRWSVLHTLVNINPVSDPVKLLDAAGLTDEEKKVALAELAMMVPRPKPPEMVLMWPGVDPKTVPQSVTWRGARWTVTVGEWNFPWLPARRPVQGMDPGNRVIDSGAEASEPVLGRSPGSDAAGEPDAHGLRSIS